MSLSCGNKTIGIIKGITLNHNSDFCCLNCLHSFTIKNKLEQHKNVCENKEFYGVGMPCQKNMILQFTQYLKSNKV